LRAETSLLCGERMTRQTDKEGASGRTAFVLKRIIWNGLVCKRKGSLSDTMKLKKERGVVKEGGEG